MVKRCNFNNQARSFAEREVGCPLDHCPCGTHDADNLDHECEFDDDEIRQAEIEAGWD